MNLLTNAFNATLGRNPSWPLGLLFVGILCFASFMSYQLSLHEDGLIKGVNTLIDAVNVVYFYAIAILAYAKKRALAVWDDVKHDVHKLRQTGEKKIADAN